MLVNQVSHKCALAQQPIYEHLNFSSAVWSTTDMKDRTAKLEIIARRLRQALARLDWPQEQLAKELGVSATTVSNWSAGKKGISLANLKRAAQVLHIEDPYWLVDEAVGQDLPEKRTPRRYGPGAYGSGQRAAWLKTLSDTLRDKDIRLLEHVDTTVRYPRFVALPMDYCSTKLALIAVPLVSGRVRPAELTEAMIRLITLEKLDNDVSIGRHHQLVGISEDGLLMEEEQALNVQCQLFNVGFSVFPDASSVVDYILRFEKM